MENTSTPVPAVNEVKPVIEAPKVETPKVETKIDPKTVPATPAKIWKLAVNGKEIDYDYSNEDNLKKDIQKALGADRTFQEAATQRKEVERVLAVLKENPAKAVLNKALGHNPGSVISQILKEAMEEGYDMKEIKNLLADQMYEWIQEENLDPKERENRELKKKLEKLEVSRKAEEEAKVRATEEAQTKEYIDKFNKDIDDTLKESGMPQTTFTKKRMAYWLDQAYKIYGEQKVSGGSPVEPTAKSIIDFVRKDYEVAIKELYGQADVETMIKVMGEEAINKIRKHDVEKLKAKQPISKPTISKSPAQKTEDKPVQKVKASKNFFKAREEEIRRLEQEGR